MNFDSKVCTTKEQSERLLALGLKKDTADMMYYKTSYGEFIGVKDEDYLEHLDFPAWSLDRLIEILDIWYLDLNFHNFANAYEQVISYFEERVKGGFIKKEYLE